MNEPVLYEFDGGVATITLNRPETRNALTEMEVVDALVASLERAQADLSVRAIVLTGAGPAFSSGGNIKHMRDEVGTFGGNPAQIRENYRRGIQRIPRAFHELDVPCIAAVNGPAHGAGCDLALMCDIRIAAQSALFAESFAKVGIIPGDGGAWLLPRVIGLSRAAEMIFTGTPIDAQCAFEWGLVSRVVPDAQLLPAAQELAQRIASNPPNVLRMSKRLIREGQRMDLPSLLELSAAFQGIAHRTADHREAIAATFEKRAPNYTGE
ncbi:Enoyl-CoA hydratase [Paraburkholderia piptadeniae]|uniref:Enoyl-CoA hydratase n=1 Tax=Paraburkholderia piptadeniae TaxID=1701573 RepID=A0A1N7S0M0_9BURK|nr:crotonase/enoyl-CoA hydratase family protein [Paraburkholderia piptadeniae]SIT40871.1 Enoyl-CoA hydratase [Paraburkholderia piptadeniae]